MTMFIELDKLKNNGTTAQFLVPGLERPIDGKVERLTEDIVVIESVVDNRTLQFVTHPNNIWVVQRKS